MKCNCPGWDQEPYGPPFGNICVACGMPIRKEKEMKGIFLTEGTGLSPENYDQSEFWKDWEEFENEEALIARIKELLNK